jgi:polyphosphate glucokinase
MAKSKLRGSTGKKHILAIDIGGTGLKAAVLGEKGKMLTERVRVDTPYPCSPKILVNTLAKMVEPLPSYDCVSVGFPGVVRKGKVVTAPHFGNKIWHDFDLAKALQTQLKKPVRLLNDAEIQGLAAIEGKGLELVVTLGTGVGTAVFHDGQFTPHLELAHHPVHHNKTYNEYIGDKVLKKIGKKKWNRRVQRVLKILHTLLNYEKIYIGGGNSEKITFKLDGNMKLVPNDDGMIGGYFLWQPNWHDEVA